MTPDKESKRPRKNAPAANARRASKLEAASAQKAFLIQGTHSALGTGIVAFDPNGKARGGSNFMEKQ